MSLFFKPMSHTFGLDIGDRSFKLAQVTRKGKKEEKKSPYFLTAWGSESVPEGVMDNGDILEMNLAIEHLKRLVKNSRGRRGRTVVASLPEAKTFIKIIRVKETQDQEELKNEVIAEVEQNIPLPIDEIYFDWQMIPKKKKVGEEAEPAAAEAERTEKAGAEGETAEQDKPGEEKKAGAEGETAEQDKPGEEKKQAEEEAGDAPKETGDSEERTVLIAAAPRGLVDKYTTLIEGAGLITTALEIEGLAITRAIVPEKKMEEAELAMLDIGATRSSLIIYDENTLQITIGIPISGNKITRVISESLNIGLEEAEDLKIECGLDVKQCEDKLWNILLPFLNDMSERIRNALRFYKIGFETGKKIERICLCGGGAYFKEIDSVLSRKLTTKVKLGNPLVNLNPKLPKAFNADTSLSYTTAIGLALRAAEENLLDK